MTEKKTTTDAIRRAHKFLSNVVKALMAFCWERLETDTLVTTKFLEYSHQMFYSSNGKLALDGEPKSVGRRWACVSHPSYEKKGAVTKYTTQQVMNQEWTSFQNSNDF